MTKKQRQARIATIIRDLSWMARDGWRHAKAADYRPLEAELKTLLAEKRKAGDR